MPILDSPKLEYLPSYIAALREGYYIGIQKPHTDDEISKIELDHQAFLDEFFRVKTEPVELPDGRQVPRVPQSKFWYMDNNKFIGEISIRHALSEHLLRVGGHIGYGIRPNEQKKGHGTNMTAAALIYCKDQLKLEKVLITCNVSNPASAKVIENNGGILENIESRDYDDELIKRYWITL